MIAEYKYIFPRFVKTVNVTYITILNISEGTTCVKNDVKGCIN